MMRMGDVPRGETQPGIPRSTDILPPPPQHIRPAPIYNPHGRQNNGNGAAAPSSEDDFIPQIIEVDGVSVAVFPQQQHAVNTRSGNDVGMAQDHEDEALSEQDVKEEVDSMTDGEQSEVSNPDFESGEDEQDHADAENPPSPHARSHAAAWRAHYQRELPHIDRVLGDTVQGQHREFINEKLRNVPTAERRVSLRGRSIGNRWDPRFGKAGDNELARAAEEPLYMSGALGEGDSLDMEKDPEFQRQLKEADKAGVVDHEAKRLERLRRKQEEEKKKKRKEKEAKRRR